MRRALTRGLGPRGQAGQALVEFALVVPILLVFSFAIVEIAQLGVARLALQHAASEGARAGALTNDDAAIHSSVALAASPLDAGRIDVEIEPTASEAPRTSDPRGSLLAVRLRYAMPLRLGFMVLPTLTISGSAARRVEWTP